MVTPSSESFAVSHALPFAPHARIARWPTKRSSPCAGRGTNLEHWPIRQHGEALGCGRIDDVGIAACDRAHFMWIWRRPDSGRDDWVAKPQRAGGEKRRGIRLVGSHQNLESAALDLFYFTRIHEVPRRQDRGPCGKYLRLPPVRKSEVEQRVHQKSDPYKSVEALAHTGDAKVQPRSLLDQRDEFVEIRSGVRACQRNADRLEELIVIDAGYLLHLVHPLGEIRCRHGANVLAGTSSPTLSAPSVQNRPPEQRRSPVRRARGWDPCEK